MMPLYAGRGHRKVTRHSFSCSAASRQKATPRCSNKVAGQLHKRARSTISIPASTPPGITGIPQPQTVFVPRCRQSVAVLMIESHECPTFVSQLSSAIYLLFNDFLYPHFLHQCATLESDYDRAAPNLRFPSRDRYIFTHSGTGLPRHQPTLPPSTREENPPPCNSPAKRSHQPEENTRPSPKNEPIYTPSEPIKSPHNGFDMAFFATSTHLETTPRPSTSLAIQTPQ
jgi:hypothetical protein